MKIIGCDLHTRYQQVALLDQEKGELIERRLKHESGRGRETAILKSNLHAHPFSA